MTPRRTLKSLSVAGLTVGLICASVFAFAPAANAGETSLVDPSGDNAGPGLDIVATSFDNADYVLTTTIDFRRHRSGQVIVGVKAHHRKLLRVVNVHDASGPDRTFLLDGSGRVACRGLAAGWDASDAEVTLSVPSTCLWQGNYGALKPWFLTEPFRSGSDVDILRTNTWTARG